MWPLNLLKRRHWIFLGACVLFLLSYFGFIGWGKVSQALERLADQPAVRERFSTPIGRGEAIVTSFMFVLLTPLAIAAALGVVAFLGAIGAGILRAILPLRDVPDYVFLTTAYVGVIVGIWLTRAYWTGPAWEFVGLIAKAILIATGPA
jgi:amino acid transporter